MDYYLSIVDVREHAAAIFKRRPNTTNLQKKNTIKKQADKMKRQLKCSYIVETLENCKGDSGCTWKAIRDYWPLFKKKELCSDTSSS